ncbi:hypothetical protein OYC64_008967 [Pagothenia borchgrevinki]|uniref:Uncharacterized protein n=1 Tax=Pagothenia borchgrevinki TaxID=8213 RepID=A0ABD2G7R5_PAGBO
MTHPTVLNKKTRSFPRTEKNDNEEVTLEVLMCTKLIKLSTGQRQPVRTTTRSTMIVAATKPYLQRDAPHPITGCNRRQQRDFSPKIKQKNTSKAAVPSQNLFTSHYKLALL